MGLCATSWSLLDTLIQRKLVPCRSLRFPLKWICDRLSGFYVKFSSSYWWESRESEISNFHRCIHQKPHDISLVTLVTKSWEKRLLQIHGWFHLDCFRNIASWPGLPSGGWISLASCQYFTGNGTSPSLHNVYNLIMFSVHSGSCAS